MRIIHLIILIPFLDEKWNKQAEYVGQLGKFKGSQPYIKTTGISICWKMLKLQHRWQSFLRKRAQGEIFRRSLNIIVMSKIGLLHADNFIWRSIHKSEICMFPLECAMCCFKLQKCQLLSGQGQCKQNCCTHSAPHSQKQVLKLHWHKVHVHQLGIHIPYLHKQMGI